MIKIGCVDALVPGATYFEKAQLLKEIGFDGIAVYGDCETWSDAQTEELILIKEELDFEVSEFCLIGKWYGHLLEEELAEKSIETICRAMDVCRRIGAVTEIEFDAPRVSEISFDHHEYLDPPQKLTDLFVKNTRRICDYAADINMGLLLEACNRYEREYNNTQASSLRLIEAVSRSNIKLLCDLFHMSLDEEDVAETLEKCSTAVGHIHLGDTNRRLPGHGSLSWDRVFGALRNIQYDGYMNLECSVFGNPEEELRKTLVFLKKYIN